MENILSRGVHRVFDLPNKASPEADVAWKLGNAECRMEEALSSMLSYTDALRVAVALNDYADRLSAEIEQRHKLAEVRTSAASAEGLAMSSEITNEPCT